MSSPFDSDASPFQGTSIDDLRQYTDVLLGAAELAEALESYPSKATDRQYRVSDPRIVELLPIPPEFFDVAGYNTSLNAATFRSIIHSKDGEVFVSSSIGLEFSNGRGAFIELIDSKPFVTFTDTDSPSIPISPQIMSDIIARMMHPSNDPMFSDFHDINNPLRANEICETLEAEQFVTTVIERIYQIDDDYQIITETKNDKLISCEVVEFRDKDSTPLALTVEFHHFATASNLYKSTPEGSEELVLDAGDLDRFGAIIEAIKRRLEPETVPGTDEF